MLSIKETVTLQQKPVTGKNSGKALNADLIPDHVTDELAIEKAKKDPKAFEILYERYFHQIFRFVFKRVQDKDETSDLVSQVFVKSFNTIKEFEYKGIPYSAWLYRVAINETNQFFKKNKNRHIVIDDQLSNSISNELDNPEDKFLLADKLAFSFMKLKPLELELIELRFYEGMNYREIGEILGFTENNSKVKTFRVLKKLKKLIGND